MIHLYSRHAAFRVLVACCTLCFTATACDDDSAKPDPCDNVKGITERDPAGTATGSSDPDDWIPDGVLVNLSAYPNPADGATTIEMALSDSVVVRVVIEDCTGKTLRHMINDIRRPGTHTFTWDLRDDNGAYVPNGIHRVVFEANDGIVSFDSYGDIRVER